VVPGGVGKGVSYSFELSEAGNYDIWYLGMVTNNDSFSKVSWGIDQPSLPTAALTLINQGDGFAVAHWASPNEGGTGFDAGTRTLIWKKAGSSQALTAGAHSLDLFYPYRTAGNLFFATDCLVVIPTAWGWEPPVASGENTTPNWTASKADAASLQKYFDALSAASAVIEDESLPTLGQAGSIYTYTETSSTNLLLPSGALTSPFIGAGDTAVTFNFNSQKGGAGTPSTSVSTITVKEGEDTGETFNVNSFDLYEDDEETPLGELEAEATVYAIAKGIFAPNKTTKAVLILALYDDEDVLTLVDCVERPDTEGTTLELKATLTLPDEDLTDYTLKAFIWSDWQLKPLRVNPVTVPIK